MTNPLTLFSSIIERAFNQGDLAVLDELISPDFVEHQFETSDQPATPSGTHLVGSTVQQLRRGAEDFHLQIEDAVVSGDTVWARLRGTRTDTGGQLGHPPTGKSFEVTVIDVARFEDGKMIEHWGVPDRHGVLLQTGAPTHPLTDLAVPGQPSSLTVVATRRRSPTSDAIAHTTVGAIAPLPTRPHQPTLKRHDRPRQADRP
jgi:predicted ester cyclase